MCEAIQKRGCHLCISKDLSRFREAEVGGYDDAGFLVEFADQMEDQCAAGFRERDIAQLVDDDAIQSRQLPDDFPSIAVGLFLDQSIDQIDRVEEAGLFAVVDQDGSKRDGDMSFARPGSAHQDEVVRLFGELPCAERAGFTFQVRHRVFWRMPRWVFCIRGIFAALS